MSIPTDIRDFLFPRLCVACGTRLLPQERGVCLRCDSTLPYTRLGDTAGNSMEQCFWGRFPISKASALFYYAKSGNVAQILYAMKYHGRKDLCRLMGRRMAEQLAGTRFFHDIDYLIPVPLHPARLRQRGYNQSEELARGLSQQTGIPLLADALTRSKNNDTQTHKGSYARWENTHALFACAARPSTLEHRHVLLIDDVATTGATLTACADALSDIAGLRLSVLTLAWAK